MPNDILKISLKYSGSDVDDGSMSVNDFIEAIKGFSSTYGKVASKQKYKHTHQIRITAIEKGSIDIQLLVKALSDNSELLGDLANFATVALSSATVMSATVKAIKWFFEIFKHTKQLPYTTRIVNNNVIIINNFGVELNVPSEVFTLFKSDEESFKADIFKIVKPLKEGHIDKAIIEAKSPNSEPIIEEVISSEKDYFDPKLISLTETQPVWITGKFNSLTKSTNKGYFYLPDGSRVLYELKAEKPEELYKFFIQKGIVEVFATVYIDDNLNKNKIDIFDIKETQSQMDFDITDEETNNE